MPSTLDELENETATTENEPSTNGDRIAAAAGEVKKKRGRHPKGCDCGRCVWSNGGTAPNASKKGDRDLTQQKRFAGVIILLFNLVAFILRRFGYEYDPKLNTEEAEEGAMHLMPLSEHLGWLVTLSVFLGFPVWMLTKVSEKFRKVGPVKEAPKTQVPGIPNPPLASETANSEDSPGNGDSGFIAAAPPVTDKVA